MNRLEPAEFRARAAEHAAATVATPGVCSFCSGPLWQLAAHDRLHANEPARRLFFAEDSGAWLALAERSRPGFLHPLEGAWMLGSSLVGPPAAAARLLLACIDAEGEEIGAILLGGLVRGGAMHRAAARALRRRGRILRELPGTGSMQIDLGDGFRAWLRRRSRKFRRNAGRLADPPPGIVLEDASQGDPAELLPRILSIQRRCHKWRRGGDIFQEPAYADFYEALLHGLRRTGALRLLFAKRDGADLAHIFGGVVADRYRGLQMSYAEEARELALGNWLQLENLRRRADEGVAVYDLGMPAPYKERWADRLQERIGLLWLA